MTGSKAAGSLMTSDPKLYTGGCLCGALRYEAFGEPIGSGHCYCADCRRASGSGFVPFMGFKAEDVRFTGEAREFRSKAANGGDAVRNRCATCMSLVFGGELGKSDSYTLYAGSLDDPPAVRPGRSSLRASRSTTACPLGPNAASPFCRFQCRHKNAAVARCVTAVTVESKNFCQRLHRQEVLAAGENMNGIDRRTAIKVTGAAGIAFPVGAAQG